MYRSEDDTRLVEELRDTAVASLPNFREKYELFLYDEGGAALSVLFMGVLAWYAANIWQADEVSNGDKISRLRVVSEIVERAATPRTDFLDNIIITGFFESIIGDQGTRLAIKRILGPRTLALLSEVVDPNSKFPVRDPFA